LSFQLWLGFYVSRKVGDRGRWVGALEGYKQDGHATITSKDELFDVAKEICFLHVI